MLKRKSDRIFILLSVISLMLGIFALISILFSIVIFAIFVVSYFIVCVVILVLQKNLRYFPTMFLFPIYPISVLGFIIFGETMEYEYESFHEESTKLNIPSSVDAPGIPIIMLRDFGTKEERINASKLVLSLFKSGEISAKEAVLSLERLTRDPHLDVTLCAADGLTTIENTLMEKIARARKEKNMEKLVESIYEYVTSGLMEGKIIEMLLKEAIEAALKIEDEEKRDTWIFKLKEYMKYGKIWR